MIRSLIKRKYFLTLAYICLLFLLAFASFGQSMKLGFYRDDWSIWISQHYFWKALIGHNHPGTWIEDYYLFKIFGFNTYLWQGLGIVLRVSAAFSVYLLVLGITKTKKIAYIAGILFAPLVIASETVTWLSVYIVPQIIILCCLSFYFWTLFIDKKKIIFAVISYVLLMIAIIGDPGRSIFILPLISLWDFLNWYVSDRKEPFKSLIIRQLILIAAILGSAKIALGLLYTSNISFTDNLKSIFSDIRSVKSLLFSIGNLLLGWLQSPQGGGLQNRSVPLLIFSILIGLYLTIVKKNRLGAAFLLFVIWMPFVYTPNWLFNKSYVSPPTDRYLGLSAVAYVGFISLIFSSFRLKYSTLVAVVFFVILNIKSANQITAWEVSFRAASFTEPLWDQIYNDVPKGEKDSLFIYLGKDYAKGVILDWSGSIPYGIRANITDVDAMPIATADTALIVKLLCEKDTRRPSMFEWFKQPNRIMLSHVHAWELNNNILTNVSIRERERLKIEAKKVGCIPIEK